MLSKKRSFILLATLAIGIQLLVVPSFGRIFPVLGISLPVLVVAYLFSRTR